jgi:hypothetical protein
MITLGLDPGVRVENPAGFAIVDFDRPLEGGAIIAAGVIPPPRAPAGGGRSASWEARIEAQLAELPALLSRYTVFYVACEGAYLGANSGTYKRLLCFGWEARVQARLAGCPFTLVSPADQARVRLSLPEQVTAPVLAHLAPRDRPHALSAIAIAWHGAGQLARRLRAAQSQR